MKLNLSERLIEEYKDAFSNKQGAKLLTRSEAQFIRAYMRLNRTKNGQSKKHKTEN